MRLIAATQKRSVLDGLGTGVGPWCSFKVACYGDSHTHTQTFSLMKGRIHLTEFSLHPSILAETFPPVLAVIPPDPPCWTHMVPGIAEHTQLSQWITPLSHPSSRDPLTSFLLSPHSLPFCSYLCLLLLPFTVREPPSASSNPSPPPLNLPASFLLYACFSVAGSSTCLITSHPVARIVFPPFSLLLRHCLCLCIWGLRARKRRGVGPAPIDEAVFSVSG